RDGERVPEQVVEADGQVPGQFDVLLLVFPDRHDVGVVGEYVRGHEDGVVEEARADGITVFTLGFELRNAVQPPERGDAVQEPGELTVLGNVRLHENYAFVRVDAGRHEDRSHAAGALPELLRVDVFGN